MSQHDDGTYDYITEMEVHLKALGNDRIIMRASEPIRWDLVENIETGGIYRLGISTSQRVIARHPSGIKMVWLVDLEPSSANGTGRLQLNTSLIRDLIEKAPEHATGELKKWLREAKQTIDKQIGEQEEWLGRMRTISALFDRAARGEDGGAA
jgi:hypothetical protein